MDIKSWTWKRRISEKNGDSAVLSMPDHQASTLNNGVPKTFGDHVNIPQETLPRGGKHGDLSASRLVSDLETEAKQHAKVAEEAVAGWEKAEADAAAVKRQLDVVLKEKAGLQDRLSHLDGALKDCTRQVRVVREEQEQKRQDLLQRKNKELDRVRAEYEAKLADVGRQLVEAGAENKVLSMTLQEHVRNIGEITDAKSRAEAEIKVLQHRIESLEKDKGVLKYEVHVLNKELQIRNEARDYSKRDIDVLNRQHTEDVKKMNKLEAECQKLRILVRRKLPGPNALAQMKMEVESLDGLAPASDGRRSRGRNSMHSDVLMQQSGGREIELLLERLLSMEEETKMLKEALAQRNGELHSCRLLCAKTATKLSALEAYFDSVSRTHGVPKPKLNGADVDCPPSVVTMSDNGTADDEVSRADAWASALIAELSQFKKDKLTNAATSKPADSSAFDIMYDFTDMERLASSTIDNPIPSDLTSEKTSVSRSVAGGDEEVGSTAAEKSKSSNEVPVKRNLEKTFENASELGPIQAEIESSKELPEGETEQAAPLEAKNSIRRGLFILEGLGEAIGIVSSSQDVKNSEEGAVSSSCKHWDNAELGARVEKISSLLTVETNKSALWDFVDELLGALDVLMSLFPKKLQEGPDSNAETKDSIIETKTVEIQTSDLSDDKVELEMMRVEKAALESHMKTELSRMASMQNEIVQLKNDKQQLQQGLDSGSQHLQQLTTQLEEAQHFIEELQMKLSLADANKEEALVIKEVEAQSRCSGTLMQDVVSRLEKELEEEYKNHDEEMKMKSNTKEEAEEPLQKERDIADAEEKLAECQRTILALGKQLKALQPPHPSIVETPKTPVSRPHSSGGTDELWSEEHAGSKPTQTQHVLRDEDISLLPSPTESPRGLFYGSSKPEQKIKEVQVNEYFSSSPVIDSPPASEPASPLIQRAGSSPAKGKQRSSLSRFFNRTKSTLV